MTILLYLQDYKLVLINLSLYFFLLMLVNIDSRIGYLTGVFC